MSAPLQMALGAFAAASLASNLSAARRNVVLLISDNQSAFTLGCYGNPELRTPNLDALARQGTRFPLAFATTPSCGPSRAVIFTGLLTHANGQYQHAHSFHNGVLASGVMSVFDILRNQGYRTALLGKANLGARAGQYQIDLLSEPGDDPNDLVGNVAKAERFIRESGDRPFLLVLATHDPQPTDRPADVRWKDPAAQLPPRRIDPATLQVPPNLPDRPDVRASLEEYYELVERLDRGAGELMPMLQRTGKADDTLVMFCSDQGAPYPNGGYSHYDPGVHVPLIVVNPENRRHGVTCDAMVTLADITPTILDWTGTKPPYPLHGRSLLPVLEQEKTKGWDSVVLSHVMHEVTLYYPMRTIRTRRYKLIWNLCHQLPWRDASEVTRWSTWAETLRRGDKFIGNRPIQSYIWRPVVELYDLQNDPGELVNLADDPQHADLRRELSEQLLARLRATGDNWLERYRLPLPGEAEQISTMSPPGYSPPRPPGRGELSIVR